MTTLPAQAIPNLLTGGQWAKRITEAWQKQVPSIFEVASLLESAEAELRKRDWTAMVRNDLPFGQSTASKLVKIARCDHLRNSDHGPNLPACWRTLYELATLTAEQFEHGIKTGAINPKLQRKDVKALRGITSGNTESQPSSFASLKRRAAEQQREIEQLKAQLANVVNFDLRKDTPKNIANVVASTVNEAKAMAIADAIKSSVKAMKRRVNDCDRPPGESSVRDAIMLDGIPHAA
jgi:ribosomal silencing factor RsfS